MCCKQHTASAPPLLPAGLVWAINRSALLPHVHWINQSVSIHLSILLPGRLLSGRQVFFFCLLSPPQPPVCLPPSPGCFLNAWQAARATAGTVLQWLVDHSTTNRAATHPPLPLPCAHRLDQPDACACLKRDRGLLFFLPQPFNVPQAYPFMTHVCTHLG